MEPQQVLNTYKVARKIKYGDKNTKRQIAEELNEIARIIINLHYSKTEEKVDGNGSNSIHESVIKETS